MSVQSHPSHAVIVLRQSQSHDTRQSQCPRVTFLREDDDALAPATIAATADATMLTMSYRPGSAMKRQHADESMLQIP